MPHQVEEGLGTLVRALLEQPMSLLRGGVVQVGDEVIVLLRDHLTPGWKMDDFRMDIIRYVTCTTS